MLAMCDNAYVFSMRNISPVRFFDRAIAVLAVIGLMALSYVGGIAAHRYHLVPLPAFLDQQAPRQAGAISKPPIPEARKAAHLHGHVKRKPIRIMRIRVIRK